jgi:hypothetical protein
LCCALSAVAAIGYTAGDDAARRAALGLLFLLLFVVWREWDWWVHIMMPLNPGSAIKLREYQVRNETTWKNATDFLGTRGSVPGSGGSENFTSTLTWNTPDAVKKREVIAVLGRTPRCLRLLLVRLRNAFTLRAQVEAVLERKDRIVIWRNFLSAEFMACHATSSPRLPCLSVVAV